MEYRNQFSTWVEVRLSAIENNVRLIQQRTNTPVMAIVKANAYGHGTVPVSKAALQGGATWLGVARIEEALELRQADFYCPILILGYIPPKKLRDAIKNQISITVWDSKQVQLVSTTAGEVGKTAHLHLKIDTGMNRIGIQPEDAPELARYISHIPHVILEGVFTHFARADEIDPTPTDFQEQRFMQVIEKIQMIIKDNLLFHAANSAASLVRSSSYLDLVRLGIAMYGLQPSPYTSLPEGFKPALSWKTVLNQVKQLPANRGISYGHEYITKSNEIIGTIPVGYGDGFRRMEGNRVLVGGEKVPVVGRVCMDYCMLKLNGNSVSQAGDEVVLIGTQGEQSITAEEVASAWKTINYEVVSGIGARVPRIYITD